MLNFIDIYTAVARRLGNTSPEGLSISRELANRIQREIALRASWPFLVDEKTFVTNALYSTGTVTTTQYGVTINGSSTVWSLDHQGWNFRLTGSNITYRIIGVDSTISLRLDRPYSGATVAGATYEIYQNEYPLERDTIGILKMRIPAQTRTIVAAPIQSLFDPERGVESAGTPVVYADAGRTKLPFYNAGTVALNEASTTVTGTTTSFITTMVGRMFRVRGERRMYRIRTFSSTIALLLDEAYRGMSQASIAYQIDPPGIPLARLWPRPDATYDVYYWRKRMPKELEDDDDISEFPDDFHDVLISGAIYLALQQRGESSSLIEMAHRDYETALRDKMNKAAITDPDMKPQLGAWGSYTQGSSFPGNYPSMSRI